MTRTRQQSKVVKISSIYKGAQPLWTLLISSSQSLVSSSASFFWKKGKKYLLTRMPASNDIPCAGSPFAHLLVQAFLQRLHPQLLPSQLHLQSWHLCLLLGPHFSDLSVGPKHKPWKSVTHNTGLWDQCHVRVMFQFSLFNFLFGVHFEGLVALLLLLDPGQIVLSASF